MYHSIRMGTVLREVQALWSCCGDLNSNCAEFKSAASANWATAGFLSSSVFIGANVSDLEVFAYINVDDDYLESFS